MSAVSHRVKRLSTSTRLPPENGERSSGRTAESVSKSNNSPDVFFATSRQKIPATVSRNQLQSRLPCLHAAAAPIKMDDIDASEILGSASRQNPSQQREKFARVLTTPLICVDSSRRTDDRVRKLSRFASCFTETVTERVWPAWDKWRARACTVRVRRRSGPDSFSDSCCP